MTTYALYILAALYLGLLTSISPCPLATNIAAISYVARKVGNTRLVINAGLLYTLGRCLLYVALAALLTTTALSIPVVSIFLQKYMHLVLGPDLPAAGHVSGRADHGLQRRDDDERADAETRRRDGHLGRPAVGRVFCPLVLSHLGRLVLRTGGLDHGLGSRGDYGRAGEVGIALPQASLPGGSLVLPLVYGIGTGVPVLVVAFLLAYSANSVGKTYNVLSKVEWWARMITGWLFILVGIWFSLTYVFELR